MLRSSTLTISEEATRGRPTAAKRRRQEFLEKVTVPTDSEVVDDKGTRKLLGTESGECKTTLKDHDIKIDDDDMKVQGRATGNGIDEAGKKGLSIRAMRPSMEVCILTSLSFFFVSSTRRVGPIGFVRGHCVFGWRRRVVDGAVQPPTCRIQVWDEGPAKFLYGKASLRMGAYERSRALGPGASPR